jgi:hypothetical protein
MVIEQLDRTAWTLEQACEHIARQLFARLMDGSSGAREQPMRMAPWRHHLSPEQRAQEEAHQELLVALRDGDLHARGRLSTQQIAPWHTARSGWRLHSGHHTHITPEQWRGGEMEWAFGTLTMSDGQFIDIRVPRFAVLAIWPESRETAQPPTTDYRSPYLDLLHRAIAEWEITEDNQPKKESLLDWFREQTIEGEPISENLASAMATLVRLPASQRGGARRAGGW